MGLSDTAFQKYEFVVNADSFATGATFVGEVEKVYSLLDNENSLDLGVQSAHFVVLHIKISLNFCFIDQVSEV